MYEQYYGLNRRPFRAAASGSDVFVGPQTAKTMQAMKKALTAGDAVVAVTGATGVGKTTLVNRALEAIDNNAFVIGIGRMQLGHDEVLDFLLEELAAENVPASTIRKITLLKRLLAERTASGSRVFVVIEDAVRVGEDALAELEALTAADGGDSDGANLVLMGGDAPLKDVLSSAALTRLKQRVRLYHAIEPFVAAELLGYLRHCFRLAGGDFDAVFDERSAEFIHALTDGVPRIANNLVESALNAGSEKKLAQIDAATIARVAHEEYGLTAELPALTETETSDSAQPEPVPDANASAPRQPEPQRPGPAKRPSEARIEKTADPQPPAKTAVPEAETDTPELIHDTLPDLEVLAADFAPDQPAEHQDDGDEEIPTLFSSGRMRAPEQQPPAPVATPAPEAQTGPEPVAAEPDPEREPEPAAAEPQFDREPVEAAPAPKPAAVAAAPEASQVPVAPEPQPEPVAAAPEHEPVAAAPKPKPEPAAAAPEADPVAAAPEPKTEPEPEVAMPETVADYDRDPTLAELRPDLDALEEAMASLAEPDADESPSVEELPELEPEPGAERAAGLAADEPDEPEVSDMTKPELPQITLDAAIQENIAEATAALEKHDATIAEDTVTEESSEVAAAAPDPKEKVSTKSTAELRSIASGLSKAKSLEDVDDAMAETLFGSGINTIAAQVLAAGPDYEPANESMQDTAPTATDSAPEPAQDIELELVAETINEVPAALPADAPAAVTETPDADKSELEKEFMDVYGENALEVSLETDSPQAGLDLSASQRLATVRALNAEKLPPAAMPPSPAAGSSTNGAAPAPIEDQIKTSMTQTFAALNVRPTAASDDDDEDEETQKKRGFFSRFRRS